MMQTSRTVSRAIAAVSALGVIPLLMTASAPTSEAANASRNVTVNKPIVTLNTGDYACTLSNPQYTGYSSDGRVYMWTHTRVRIDLNQSEGNWAESYLVAGYNPAGYNSETCNRWGYGKSLPLPILISHAGAMPTSISLYTTASFGGDGGYDIWLTQNPADHTYAQMVSSKANTELMVWATHPRLGIWATYGGNPVAFNVLVDGRYWDILHAGRTAGHPWEYLVFATSHKNTGSFTMNNIRLGVLMAWAIAHGYVNRSDTIQAIDAGYEGHESTGGTAIRSYSLQVG
jgi:hypothetical protein